MSDLSVDFKLASQAFAGKVSWNTVAATVEAQASAILSKDPTAAAFVGTALTTVKQGLSNAIGQVDSALAANAGRVAAATETAIEAELALLTHGLTVPYDAFVSDGIDKLVAAAVTAAHAYGLQLKAKLATAPTPGAGSQQNVGAAVIIPAG